MAQQETAPTQGLPPGGTLRSLDPDKITRDPRLQPREVIDSSRVEEYREAMERGDILPPVVVFYDGQHHWLGDGFTRTLAAIKAEQDGIDAWVVAGTFRDAWLYSRGANAAHGLPRSRADLYRAIDSVLLDDACRAWSNDRIAELVKGTDHKVVERRRVALEEDGKIPILERLEGVDGRIYARRRPRVPDPMAPVVSVPSGQADRLANSAGLGGAHSGEMSREARRPPIRVVNDEFSQAGPPEEGFFVDAPDADAVFADDEPVIRIDAPAVPVEPPPDFSRSVLRDIDDVPVPDHLRGLWTAFNANEGAVHRALQAAKEITGKLLNEAAPHKEALGEDWAALEGLPATLGKVGAIVYRARPALVCKTCNAEPVAAGKPKCKACKGRGWLPASEQGGGR